MSVGKLFQLAIMGVGAWWVWAQVSPHFPTSWNAGARATDAGDFYRELLGNIDREWSIMLGNKYRPPVLVLFASQTHTGNGMVSARTGPMYNPADGKIYVPVSFEQVIQRLSGCSGNPCQAADAFVLAHEIGHRVQDLLGLMHGGGEDTELQADCLSGAVLSHKNKRLNGAFIEPGDMDVIIRLVHAMGDDVITHGHPPPPEHGHGNAAQRVRKFTIGWHGGTLETCMTRGAI